MILVDNALAERQQHAKPVRVAIVGAGYSGRNIAAAREAYSSAGVTQVRPVETQNTLEQAIRDECFAVTDDAALVCEAEGIDAIIEATGTIEFAAGMVLRAVEHEKHIILEVAPVGGGRPPTEMKAATVRHRLGCLHDRI